MYDFTDEEINEENQRTQLFFKRDMSYIIEYILKHKYELIHDRRYHTKDPVPQYVSEPNELYRLIITTENDIESILKGLLSHVESNSFKEFSSVVENIICRLIEKMRGEKYDGEEEISNTEWYFMNADEDYGRDSLYTLHKFEEDSSYFRPNTVCARMVIKWIALYMIVQKTNSIDSMDDIDDFSFTYDEYNKTIRLFIWTRDQHQQLQFLYKQPYHHNVLNVTNWEPVWSADEEKDKDISESFGLPLSTIVSEIKSLYANYQTIIINNANPNDFTNEINEVFKIRIKDSMDIRGNVRYLVNCNSDIPDNHLFKKFAKDLKQIINKITNFETRCKWFFETRTGRVEDDVSVKMMPEPDYSYYKPKIEEARIAITWVILYKLCKYYKLDRTKIYTFVIYYYPKADYLRIKITIDGKDHSYLLTHAKEKNILDVDKWEECTNFCLVTTMEDDDIDKVEEKKVDNKYKEEKDQRMKKLLKLMLISQMMNSQK